MRALSSLLSLGLLACPDPQAELEEPVLADPSSQGTPVDGPPPVPNGQIEVIVSAVGATQVLVDGQEAWPIKTAFALSPGRHSFVLVGPDGARSQAHVRDVTPPNGKPVQILSLPPFVPAPAVPAARRPLPAPEVHEPSPQPGELPSLSVRVLVTAGGATSVRVDDQQTYAVGQAFELPSGTHTFVLVGEGGTASPPYTREILPPRNKPMRVVVLPDLVR